MKLAPREVEKLGLHNAGYLAQKRLARGLKLNYIEAVALIATQVRTLYAYIYVCMYASACVYIE
jgi:urease gamma subunit